jgi:hypothetical protein
MFGVLNFQLELQNSGLEIEEVNSSLIFFLFIVLLIVCDGVCRQAMILELIAFSLAQRHLPAIPMTAVVDLTLSVAVLRV